MSVVENLEKQEKKNGGNVIEKVRQGKRKENNCKKENNIGKKCALGILFEPIYP
jgi:hypothetical protein